MKSQITDEVKKLSDEENALDEEKKDMVLFLSNINSQIKTDAMKLQNINDKDEEAANESKAELK